MTPKERDQRKESLADEFAERKRQVANRAHLFKDKMGVRWDSVEDLGRSGELKPDSDENTGPTNGLEKYGIQAASA